MRNPVVTIAMTGGVAAVAVLGSAGAASAKTIKVCDAYGSNCHKVIVKPIRIEKHPGVQVKGEKLPFTGGEIALMSIAGVGALGAGTMLVAAGRRRRVTA
jgi:ABC-type glycerol-3-phosphate transport system substrate-binding protein